MGGTYDLLGPAGAFAYSTRPAKAGENLILFGVGFGPTTPSVAAGQLFTGSAPTVSQVSITIGEVPAYVQHSGITGAGLYRFNLVMPNTGSGDQSAVASGNGATANNAVID